MQKGFTLIELLAAIFITLLLLAIAIPGFRALMPNVRLKSATKELASNLRQAQQNTVTEQITFLVKIDTNTNSYSIIKRETIDTTIEQITLDSALEFSAVNGFTNNEIIFNTAGAVSEAGNITISLNDGRSRTVNVKPSGFVTISE